LKKGLKHIGEKKMNNLFNKSSLRKTTVAILTILMIVAIAAPLVSFATAAGAPTASLGKTSGPNGTVVSISGTGFGVSEAVAAITVSVDGHAGTFSIKTTTSASPGVNPGVTISSSAQLATDVNGVLSGNIILYGLSLGAHTVIISDATTSVVAGTFTITAPTVTLAPSSVSAGSSVIVTGSGFPSGTVSVAYTNVISAATFAGSSITVASGSTTANPAVLSSNVLFAGAFTGTVSLPGITTGSSFTLTDAWNNVATTTPSLTTPTVTLSPNSGPVGTVVTATLTGFGPTATISSVAVGNIAGSLSTATVTPTATVTEQGTSVFLFQMPAGTTTTKAGVAGAQAVNVTDSLGNTQVVTFTIIPKVTIALGDTASGSSGTTFAPASTASKLFIQASGFKASTEIQIITSPTIPTQWKTPSATWTVNTGSFSAITSRISTDANGLVDVVSDQGTSPAQAGQYAITISDGTTSVSTTITITTSGNIIAATGTSPEASTGVRGSTVTVTYFGAAAPTSITLDSSVVATPVGATQTWPLVSTNTVTFTLAAGAGLHTIAAGFGFNSVPFTVITPTVTVISPSSASVGTTVTVVGSGFATGTALLSIQGGAVTTATNSLVLDTLIATFAVPNYIPGSYTLSLSDSSGGITINTATTTINVAAAQIQINPISGTPTSAFGTAITIALTGSGFKASDTLTVMFDATTITAATPVGLTVVNTNGAILIDSGFRIPTVTTAGAHTISVIGSSGATATTTYTIIPKLASIAAVRPGAQVAITGAGFAANSLQTLTINGTVTAWLNVGVTPATAIPVGTPVVTDANGNLMTSTTVGFVVSSTTASGILNIVVTDASGNTATTTLTVLSTPAITLGATVIVPGTIATGVSIAGSGFTPGSRAVSANLFNGATLVAAVTLSASPVTVGNAGTFAATAENFKVPASVTAGTYTLRFAATTPAETADATITVLGAPTLTAPTTAASGANVTIIATGLSAISTASFSGIDLIATSAFGSATVQPQAQTRSTRPLGSLFQQLSSQEHT